MEKISIHGSHSFSGTISVSGFKHSLVLIMCASLMADEPVVISNVSDIEDVRVLIEIFSILNVKTTLERDELTIDARNFLWSAIPDSLSSKIHGSQYLIPCILAKVGLIEISGIGGCQIGDNNGERPLHHIFNVLERFGASFEYANGSARGTCKKLKSTEIDIRDYCQVLHEPSGPLLSGATKTALLAAAMAEGTSKIKHPYRKAEVIDMIDFLKTSGISIEESRDMIIVEGKPALRKTRYEVIPDLLEVMTFFSYAVSLKKTLCIKMKSHQYLKVENGLDSELSLLKQMGVRFGWSEDKLFIKPPEQVYGVDIDVSPNTIYSDSHPFFTLMLLSADRPCKITENVWKNRFHYASQLSKLGACLNVQENAVKITPSNFLKPQQILYAADLRSAAVLLIAALRVNGVTTLENSEHLKRGYPDLVEKLKSLGAQIEK
jgi:UDP-N-acetylglucosamine 1-carboxyvinyltransferase